MTRILSFTSLFVAMVFVVVHATDDTCTMDKDLLKLLEDKNLKGAVSALKAYGVHHLETLEILSERETDCNWKWWGGCSHGVDTMVQKHGLKIMLGELLKNKLPSLVADLQDIKKRKEKAEQKRLREEAEQKRLREEAEQKRLKEEAEQKLKEELAAAQKSPYELVQVILKMLPIDASDKLKKAIGDLVHNQEEKLDLSNDNISDEGAKALAEALKVNTALHGLSLFNNKISDEGAKALAEALKVNTALHGLNLVSNKISDEGAKALAEALKVNTALRWLYLFNNKISDEGAKALAEALKVNTALQHLTLAFNNISDEGAKALAEALKVNMALQELDLSHNYNISDEGAKALAEALQVNTALRKLCLEWNKISDAVKQQIKTDKRISFPCWEEPEQKRLKEEAEQKRKELFVEAQKSPDELVEVILKMLPINANNELKKAIGDLIHNKVDHLSLFNNNISDEGAKALAEALKVNTALQWLNLSLNSISDEGAKALAEALKVNMALQELDLSHNYYISDEGAKALAEALKVNMALQHLDLTLNKISDEGAMALAEALKVNTALRVLFLKWNKISHAVKQQISTDKRIQF